ncbi:MAG: PEP-CTERM sorting domain-containing protein [Planctomycetota bacterium]|nr:MAG: PEP-CTERM sorting domain-containing protein [Planctomycetota bacterium]
MLVAVMAYCRPASAEFFQYSTTTDIGAVVPAGSTVMDNSTNFVTIMTPASTPIQITGLDTTGQIENLDGSGIGTDIIFGLIDVLVVNATPGQTVSIEFTFHVNIDNYDGDTTASTLLGSGTFDVHGTVSGTIGSGRKVNMSTFNIDPIPVMNIGGQPFELTINTLVPPGPFFSGAIGAHVTVIPEPATATLLGLGIFAMATPALRRWRRKPRQ